MASVALLAPGSRVDRFRIGARLHVDLASATYEATDVETGRAVELRLQQPWCTAQRAFAEQFLAAIAAASDHPHALACVGGISNEILFAACARVPGRSLDDVLGDRLDPSEAIAFVRALCRTHASVHARGSTVGVLPAAIFVLPRRELAPGHPYREPPVATAQLAAIDVFAHLAPPQPTKPVWFADAGGPRYGVDRVVTTDPRDVRFSSPERLLDKPLDARSDVYALAALTYHLVTGQHPFPDATRANLLTSQLKCTPRRPSELAPQLSPGADTAIVAGLAKNRSERPPDVTTFAAALGSA
jgi:hypothetical protein